MSSSGSDGDGVLQQRRRVDELVVAAWSDNMQNVRRLVLTKGVDVNSRDSEGRTVLCIAGTDTMKCVSTVRSVVVLAERTRENY